MKRWNLALALAALLLIFGSGIRGAMAYFTTYIVADGGYEIRLGGESTVSEDVSAWTKRLAIRSEEGSEPVFVRARGFCGSQVQLRYFSEGDVWTDGGDGYYYCENILYGGQTAAELDIYVGGVPEDAKPGDAFHVIVVYETTPVLYREDGTPYADWSLILQTASEGGEAP